MDSEWVSFDLLCVGSFFCSFFKISWNLSVVVFLALIGTIFLFVSQSCHLRMSPRRSWFLELSWLKGR